MWSQMYTSGDDIVGLRFLQGMNLVTMATLGYLLAATYNSLDAKTWELALGIVITILGLTLLAWLNFKIGEIISEIKSDREIRDTTTIESETEE